MAQTTVAEAKEKLEETFVFGVIPSGDEFYVALHEDDPDPKEAAESLDGIEYVKTTDCVAIVEGCIEKGATFTRSE